jgi:hypothetical protein
MYQNNAARSTSFLQNQPHVSKSDKFVAIEPAQIEAVLNDHGFDLVHLKTGRAKSADRQDFQTTIARYRSRSQFEINGSHFDLIFKVPHLYGKLVGVLGLFRGACANQLNVGKHFETIKVAHLANPVSELDSLIPMLVAQQASLVEMVKMMQARTVSPIELAQFATEVAQIRLAQTENVCKIYAAPLLKVRRTDDAASDLWTCLNVVQENLIRGGVGYQTETFDINNIRTVRNCTARNVSEQSARAIDLNGSIWDAASKLLTA